MKFFTKKNIKLSIVWLLSSIVVLLSVLLYLLRREDVAWQESLEILASSFLYSGFWFLLFGSVFGFLLIRYLYLNFRLQGIKSFAKKFSLLILLPVGLIFSAFKLSDWYTHSETFEYTWDHSVENTADTVKQLGLIDGKIRGLHLFGTRRSEYVEFQPLVKNNIEFIVQVPYGWQENYRSSTIHWQGRRNQSIAARDSSMTRLIEKAKSKGIQTLIKPHIWLGDQHSGNWRADILFKDEQEWEEWSEDYTAWILHYAKLSEQLELPLFCIGTELCQIAKNHPKYWRKLIKSVRKVYSGKITYAANWHDEYEYISFWDDLDYIGIQAYFPLSKSEEPNVGELKKGWQTHLKKLATFSKKYDTPILFTEIGYKSTPDAAITPWEWANHNNSLYTKISNETQANCYEAFFQTVWQEDWLAGALFWQWHAQHHRRERYKDINFTPQNKPAENILGKWFNRLIVPD